MSFGLKEKFKCLPKDTKWDVWNTLQLAITKAGEAIAEEKEEHKRLEKGLLDETVKDEEETAILQRIDELNAYQANLNKLQNEIGAIPEC